MYHTFFKSLRLSCSRGYVKESVAEAEALAKAIERLTETGGVLSDGCRASDGLVWITGSA